MYEDQKYLWKLFIDVVLIVVISEVIQGEISTLLQCPIDSDNNLLLII